MCECDQVQGRKIKQGEGQESGAGVCCLAGSGKALGLSCAVIWGKSIPASENNRCKGPGAKVCLACLSNNEEASVVGEGE